jgi:hypothetical protein
MKQLLIKILKTLFADMRKSIMSIILGSALLSVGGVYLFAKNVWNLFLSTMQSPTPLWATIALVFLVGVYIYLKKSKVHSLSSTLKPKYYKYCPDCDYGIDANRSEIYCNCGTKYFDKCPSCGQKIIRDIGRVCSFCGKSFPLDRIPI